jgi:hypothetical protein
MRRLKLLPILALSALLTFCAPPPPPAPAPPPASAPAPRPPASPPIDWRYGPFTLGGWSYRAEGAMSVAAFASGGAAQPIFTVRCDRQVRTISLNRTLPAPATQPGTLKLVTTFGESQWPAAAPDPLQPLLTVRLAATDPMLDKFAYSLGRVMIQASGTTPLILPAWPEIARVIEDCRG